MKLVLVVALWTVAIMGLALSTIVDLLDAERMSAILPLLALGAVLHIGAVRRRQGAICAEKGC